MKILLGEYQLRHQVYGGLGGRLWLADELLGRRKVWVRLLPKPIRNDKTSIERIQSQFNKMKPVLQELNINNLIFPERFCVVAGSEPFLVSRFVGGDLLGGYVRKWAKVEGCFPLYLVPKIFEPIAWMLEAMRQRDFVHRFLTPDSIVINQTDGVILSDFELTGIIREQVTKIDPQLLAREISKIRYIAPEILCGQPVTHFADQYSLAIIIYEILAGNILFTADKMDDLLQQIKEFVPLDIPNCPTDVSQIIRKALNPNPSLRFQTSKQFINELISACNNGTTNQSEPAQAIQINQLQKKRETLNRITVESTIHKKDEFGIGTIELPKVLSEIEPAITFQEVTNKMNLLLKDKKIESEAIEHILRERRTQKMFFWFYLMFFAGCVIAAIILREPIAVMIGDLMNW
ncbi:MAG: protein kinase [Planctomycetaceae bacterium]|jgi:serine/threonine protein kinase|nr:protein kinase [Planctomycetaceae bacterium]